MKEPNKCPYCKAPIQENASFCLHCMKQLDSKETIAKKKSKKPILIILICLLVLLILTALLIYCFYKKDPPSVSVGADTSASETEKGGEKDSHALKIGDFFGFGKKKSASSSNNSSSEKTESTKSASSGSSSTSVTTSTHGTDTGTHTSDPETKKPADTPSHTHKYTSETVKSATCGNDGEKKYTCSCGASYTEKIPATGKHSWTTLTKTVHHDATGHYENVKTSDAVTWYRCPQCSTVFYSLNEYYTHFDSVHVAADPGIRFIRDSYVHGTIPTQYDQVWIVDRQAYDETVITGYKCSVCGATKSK